MNQKITLQTKSEKLFTLTVSQLLPYESNVVQCCHVIDAHHNLDISATDRAAGAHIDNCIITSGAEPSVAARDK